MDDYYRGIFSIYEFNNTKPTSIRERRVARNKFKQFFASTNQKYRGLTSVFPPVFTDEREKMVNILSFCFMPNHIHLLLKQIKDNGITKFMQKVGTGFGGYFNRKYQRRGHVFQNRFKDIHIKDDGQLMTVVNYIHANPISLIEPNFKEVGIKNHSPKEVMEFLENYRWSSYQDYIGIKNFPTVTEREFILKIMGGEGGIKDNIKDWVLHKKEVGGFGELFLEE